MDGHKENIAQGMPSSTFLCGAEAQKGELAEESLQQRIGFLAVPENGRGLRGWEAC